MVTCESDHAKEKKKKGKDLPDRYYPAIKLKLLYTRRRIHKTHSPSPADGACSFEYLLNSSHTP